MYVLKNGSIMNVVPKKKKKKEEDVIPISMPKDPLGPRHNSLP